MRDVIKSVGIMIFAISAGTVAMRVSDASFVEAWILSMTILIFFSVEELKIRIREEK